MSSVLLFLLGSIIHVCSSINFGRKEQNGFSSKHFEVFNKLKDENERFKYVNNFSRHWPKDSLYEHRNVFSLSRLASLGSSLTKYCKKSAKCVKLNFSTCFGMRLPYSKTSLDLVDGLSSQEKAQQQLQEWRRLVHVPKCWAVIQPFLCSIYMPRCDNDEVYLPSQEMCKVIMIPCRILGSYETWPAVFQCDNATRYPSMCQNDVRELRFNTTGRCLEPLVQTDLSSYYYDGIDGCGVQCYNPLFTPNERDEIHKMIAWAATICMLLNSFAVATFMIDWRHSSRYPALAIFYINFCFLLLCFGWLAQYLPGGREDIVCRKDGTLRMGEPRLWLLTGKLCKDSPRCEIECWEFNITKE